MDPLTAIGIIANVVQFIDFGQKLVLGSVEIYQAQNGTTSSNAILEDVTCDLNEICHGLQDGIQSAHLFSQTKEEARLVPLLRSCSKLAQAFLTDLEKLKAKGRRQAWRSIRQALRCLWNAKDRERHEKELGLYRSEISLSLLVIMKDQQDRFLITQTEQSANICGIAGALNKLVENHRQLGLCSENHPVAIRRQIMEDVQQILEKSNEGKGTAEDKLPSQMLSRIHENLRLLASESKRLQKEIDVIASLRFEGIREREESIKEAHPTTFEWLFKKCDTVDAHEKRPHILDWLKSGTGAYWVSGKAGSGKSTLMKFFYDHPKTRAALREWAGDAHLSIARFFFWNAGTVLQKSQLGLLQTLLLHVFTQAPHLIEDVCPSRWEERHLTSALWRLNEIKEVFAKLGKQCVDYARFCFFIDGLDEYDGDHFELIEIINDFAASASVKICFSSRPWNIFEKVYGENNGLKIELQDLNRSDIEKFAKDRLNDSFRSTSLEKRNEDISRLVTEIAERSDGVFLWVFLAVNSLRRGMTNLDTPAELQKRLRELPTEMEEFFRLILNATEKVYHGQAARIYQIVKTAEQSLFAIDLAWFDEPDPQFGLRVNELDIDHSKLAELSEKTVIRVKARCQDLLEFWGTKLQFLHRTVKDFLDTKDIAAELSERAGNDFNPHRFICNSMLLQMSIKARLENPTRIHVEPFYRMLRTFSIHARHLDESGKLDLRLLTELDQSAHSFLGRLDPRNHLGEHSKEEAWLGTRLRQADVKGDHSRSVDTAVKYKRVGIAGYISKQDPLLNPLIYMEPSEERLAEVEKLLFDGHDPNGVSWYYSPWRRYVSRLEYWSNKGGPLPHNEKKIIQALINHGANPHFPQDQLLMLQKHLPKEDYEELAALIQNPPRLPPQRGLVKSIEETSSFGDRLVSPGESTFISEETSMPLRNKRALPFTDQNDSESASDADHENDLNPPSAVSKRIRAR